MSQKDNLEMGHIIIETGPDSALHEKKVDKTDAENVWLSQKQMSSV